tara:strand:- start:21915 stop:22712 length:798 start_codon:yes stop_codon:yes gene_type:complete
MNKEKEHNDFEALCAGYVLDALSDEEVKEFENMLKNASPEQRDLLAKMERVRDEFPLMTEPVAPSASVEEKLFADLASRKKPLGSTQGSDDKVAGRIIPLWAYKAAAALFLIGSLTLAWMNADLTDRVSEQEAVITELQSEMERQDRLLDVLAAREVKLVMMGGLDPSPDGYGKILWDPENRQAVLQLANLPAPDENRDYQLWLIKDGENPISAGVFNFDQSANDLFFQVENLEEPSPVSNAFAVTLEPKGGVPQPTGDMFLLGQ